MKMQNVSSVLSGIQASQGEVEGNKYSSTTFYLPADVAASANVKAMGSVTVPYKFGDASEFDKWAHLSKAWPVGGVNVLCDFDVVMGKDAQGRPAPKIVLTAIKTAGTTPNRPAV